MTPRALILEITGRFRRAGIPDPETDSALLLSALLGVAPLRLRMDVDTLLSEETLREMESMAARREQREPLQYILGEAPCCGRMFEVNEGTLIPRPETEELCRWALESIRGISSPTVLDLCSGSGCIGLTIKAERPDAQVTLSDLSEAAMSVAEKNMNRMHVSVQTRRGDLFSALDHEAFDLMVSNPPYIPTHECETLQPEVQFEPLTALDGGKDGLAFYRRIAEEGKAFLKPGGKLMLEVGDGEADAVADLLQAHGWTGTEVRKDLMGIKRMVAAGIA